MPAARLPLSALQYLHLGLTAPILRSPFRIVEAARAPATPTHPAGNPYAAAQRLIPPDLTRPPTADLTPDLPELHPLAQY